MQNWFAAAAAGVLALFGGVGGQHVNTTTPNFNGDGAHRPTKDMRVASSSPKNVDMTCVAAAVAAREASLSAGISTYTTAVNTAYTTRASALATAYGQTGNDAIKAAVKTASQQFSTSVKGAKTAWQKAAQTTWNTFRTAIKSCGSNASSIVDTSNASADVNGL